MSTIQPPTVVEFYPSIIAKDKDDQPILIINVIFSGMYASPDLEILKMEKYQHQTRHKSICSPTWTICSSKWKPLMCIPLPSWSRSTSSRTHSPAPYGLVWQFQAALTHFDSSSSLLSLPLNLRASVPDISARGKSLLTASRRCWAVSWVARTRSRAGPARRETKRQQQSCARVQEPKAASWSSR